MSMHIAPETTSPASNTSPALVNRRAVQYRAQETMR
jgi:hypothetical protein